MVRPVEQSPPRQKTQTTAWCPNCGIPKTAVTTLEKLLKRKRKLMYRCKSCGFKCIIKYPTKKELKEEEPIDFSMKDAVNTAKGIKTIVGFIK